LLITFAAYFSIAGGRDAAQDKLTTIVNQALRYNDLSKIEDVLHKLIIVKGLDQDELIENYKNLIAIVSDLRQRKIDDAVAKISALTPASFRGLISGNPEISRIFNRIQGDFAELESSYKKFQADQKQAPKRIETILKQLNRDLTSLNNIAFEAAALFSLAPFQLGKVGFDENKSIIKIQKVPFYREGILRGIPVLKGIPEGIKTRLQLRDQLDKVGGSINLSGTNLAVEFDLKIKKMADEARGLYSKVFKLEQEYQRLNTVETKAEFESPQLIKSLTSDIVLLIVKSLQKNR
jgi:hypothetical protein